MSTFDGIITEIPNIRVDYFRRHAELPPPLACFLSHIHSDHLVGLETLKSPFVYCTAATREMLLCLETYPSRINYAKGLLEARVQTYKHLQALLKPLPLETPTLIEVGLQMIQVTLFDANHCPGSCMFLFESDNKAVLYTGDIRSEPWHVDALTRSPCMIEYAHGLKTLDKIYLDTSFLEDVSFQGKADGMRELLSKVQRYPEDTVFYFQAWTVGYEHVWVALSKALNSMIHVDDYKMRLYMSLQARNPADRKASVYFATPEAAALVGHMCGNTFQPGCLTSNENVRIHSCEKDNYCDIVKKGPVVRIQPIIAHLPDRCDMLEIGIGGGGEDFVKDVELTCDTIILLSETIEKSELIGNDTKVSVLGLLNNAVRTGRTISLDIDTSALDEDDDIKLKKVIKALERLTMRGKKDKSLINGVRESNALPKIIRVPYSRHSSYPELCVLLKAFKARDIWPCTEHSTEWLNKGQTIAGLFGQYCSGNVFAYDQQLTAVAMSMPRAKSQHETQSSRHSQGQLPILVSQPTSLVTTDVDKEAAATSPDIDYRVRQAAYDAMLASVSSQAGWQGPGLLSTTDHHTRREVELDDG